MSEYIVVTDIDMDDGDCIVKALKELGYPCTVHAEPKNLHGFQGDKREQKAHIIVDKGHVGVAANDVGFLKKANGKYEMIISAYDKSARHADNFLKKLPRNYAAHKVIKTAATMGIRVTSKVEQDGEIHIHARAY